MIQEDAGWEQLTDIMASPSGHWLGLLLDSPSATILLAPNAELAAAEDVRFFTKQNPFLLSDAQLVFFFLLLYCLTLQSRVPLLIYLILSHMV